MILLLALPLLSLVNRMITAHRTLLRSCAIILLALALGIARAAAQDTNKTEDFAVGRKGELHFYVPVRAGSTLLQPGTYEIQHILDGSGDIVSVHQHAVVFRKMSFIARHKPGKNVLLFKQPSARVRCALGDAAVRVSKTAVTLRTNAAGEKEIADLQIAGEAFKHVFETLDTRPEH